MDTISAGAHPLGDAAQPLQEDWLERVRPVIQQRIDRYRGEVRFNLMAVIRSRRDALADRIAALQRHRDQLEAALPGAPWACIILTLLPLCECEERLIGAS